MADRLACGRSPEALLTVAGTRLFHIDGGDELPARAGNLTPKRGLQAMYDDKSVYILDTFLRRSVAQADVAFLEVVPGGAGADRWYKLGRVLTVPAASLTHVSLTCFLEVSGVFLLRFFGSVSLGSCVLAAMVPRSSSALAQPRPSQRSGAVSAVPQEMGAWLRGGGRL